MSTFECPHCQKEYDIGGYPDHLTDMRGNRFTFECECGAEFECAVDWEPDIYPDKSTLKPPATKETPG
jgi:transcription elongation factor Elf1